MRATTKWFQQACKISPQLKHSLWRLFYQYLVRMDRDNELVFMNYGYAYLNGKKSQLALAEADQTHIFCIQLYHYATGSRTLVNSDVLDVGCGRGGGPSFIARYLGPKKMVGLDYSRKAVDFCTRHHLHPALSFFCGNAESLPFGEDTFDYVLNIESSRCYSSMASFLRQVKRVLRPLGYFFFADFRHRDEIPALEEQFAASGMRLVAKEWITENVLRALDIDHERKFELLKKKAPPLMAGILGEFIGIRGSSIYRLLESRENEYIHYILQKA